MEDGEPQNFDPLEVGEKNQDMGHTDGQKTTPYGTMPNGTNGANDGE